MIDKVCFLSGLETNSRNETCSPFTTETYNSYDLKYVNEMCQLTVLLVGTHY